MCSFIPDLLLVNCFLNFFSELVHSLLKTLCKRLNKIYAHVNGGPAPGSAHARPSAQPPIDMSEKFPAHVSAESPSKFSKKPKKN